MTLQFALCFGALNDGDILAFKQVRKNGAILLYFRCLSPNFTTLYLCRKQIIGKSIWTGLAIGFGSLNDGDILAP